MSSSILLSSTLERADEQELGKDPSVVIFDPGLVDMPDIGVGKPLLLT